MAGAYFRRIRVLGVALLLTVLFSGMITPAYAGTYFFITKWGSQGSADGQFKSPKGVAVDASGNIYVADTGNDRVQKFTDSGGFILKWGSEGSGDGQFDGPHDVAVDGAGNIYVTDYNNHRVQKFTSSFSFILKWGGQGSYDGQFRNPDFLAVDAVGRVYVADTDNHRVQKFTGSVWDGGFITKWGSFGSGDGQFKYPEGVAVDASGNVYVADQMNNRVQKFATEPALGYTLTITAFEPGTTDPLPGIYEYAAGAVAVVSAIPGMGYIFDHWELDGDDVGSTNPISVTMNTDHTLHAVFSWVGTYNLTITTTTGGTTNPTPGIYEYTAGAVAVVSAIPDTDYAFYRWELDGDDVGSTNPISVTMNTDHTLHAAFVYTGGPGVPEYPGADISIVAATFAFLAAFYLTLKRKKQPHPTTSVTRPSKA